MDILEVTQFLLTQGFMVKHKGKYKVTQAFYQAVENTPIGALPAPNNMALNPLVPAKAKSPKQLFVDFILHDVKVPQFGTSPNGHNYALNTYSEEGCKAFCKALEEYSYQGLVQSTKLYYASKIDLKKSVGKYFSEGHWRTYHEQLMNAAEQGEDKLIQHLKDSTTDGSFYERG